MFCGVHGRVYYKWGRLVNYSVKVMLELFERNGNDKKR
jgi:hypothetical protein